MGHEIQVEGLVSNFSQRGNMADQLISRHFPAAQGTQAAGIAHRGHKLHRGESGHGGLDNRMRDTQKFGQPGIRPFIQMHGF